VPGAIGEQDISGPYEVVQGWPKDLSTLPGHEKWTYGGARGIFAESPNRVFLLGGGELPNIPRPQQRLLTDVGPNVHFPINGLPWRNANTATPPGGGGSGQDPARGMGIWRGASAPYRELGIDARWEHCIIVVDAQGNIIEDWTQWDRLFKRPHAIYISPYDPQKHVWVVDDHVHAIYKFSNGRRSARLISLAPTGHISIGRHSWHGCRTAVSSSPTAIMAPAWRNSTPTGVSFSISVCGEIPERKPGPAI
jgi:hypothetical protein